MGRSAGRSIGAPFLSQTNRKSGLTAADFDAVDQLDIRRDCPSDFLRHLLLIEVVDSTRQDDAVVEVFDLKLAERKERAGAQGGPNAGADIFYVRANHPWIFLGDKSLQGELPDWREFPANSFAASVKCDYFHGASCRICCCMISPSTESTIFLEMLT